MDRIEFGQKINNVPMMISWGVGIIVGLLIAIFAHQVLIGVILGITVLVLCALLFTRSMADFYGHWSIDDKNIIFHNYQNFSIRFQSVLFPFGEDKDELQLTDIKALKVVVGKDMNAPANILGGSFNAPEKIMFHLPTPYYLEIQLKDGRTVNLDLSADWDDTETIEYVIALICDRADIEAGIVKQS